jgi:hypothetical protein
VLFIIKDTEDSLKIQSKHEFLTKTAALEGVEAQASALIQLPEPPPRFVCVSVDENEIFFVSSEDVGEEKIIK